MLAVSAKICSRTSVLDLSPTSADKETQLVDVDDPVMTNPEHYRLLWENERVRVLEYIDEPGAQTTPHVHPDTVMVTLTAFERKLITAGHEADVALPAGRALWLPAQKHAGINTGRTATHTLLIELKGPSLPAVAPAL